MQYFFDHLDWLGIKLNGVALLLAAITGNEVALTLACIASLSTIAYNMYKYRKDKKQKP